MPTCPDCGERLNRAARQCACGWQREERPPDHRCAFTYEGVRCPFPGVISESPVGKTKFWCHHHIDPVNRAFDFEQSEFFRVYSDPQCRADQMAIWYPDIDWREERIAEIRAAHPEWERRDDETRSQYTERMLALGKTGFRSLVKKQKQEQ